jgi:hypothetical protein
MTPASGGEWKSPTADGAPINVGRGRIIHLPRDRTLTPVGKCPIVIDLATSQVSGLIIHEPEENVRRVLGPPDVASDKAILYGPHGLGIRMIFGVHAFHFVLTAEAARTVVRHETNPEPVLARFAQNFTPCHARVIGRGDGLVQLRPDLSRAEIEAALGAPDKVTEWKDSSITLTYFGRVPDGDYDRLHLDFSFRSGRFQGVYLTH